MKNPIVGEKVRAVNRRSSSNLVAPERNSLDSTKNGGVTNHSKCPDRHNGCPLYNTFMCDFERTGKCPGMPSEK